MTSESLSLQIARHVLRTRYEDIPADAIDAAKRSLLDAVGVTLAASTLGEPAAPFAEIAREAANPNGGTVIGYGFKAAPAMAAFANGAMAHSLDYEDTFDPALVHPNAAVVPASLAIAESIGASGRDLLAAIAIGCDLVCRIGLSVDGKEAAGFSPRFIAGGLGSTAAVGRLLGLTEEQLVHAFALSMFQASFSSEAMTYAASQMRAVRDAFGAKAGLIGAQLARHGIQAFDKPFEGKFGWYGLYTDSPDNAQALLDGLGEDFKGTEVSFKPWPSCRGTHAYIEAGLALMAQDGIGHKNVAAVEAVVSPFFSGLCVPQAQKRRPQTAIDAKFSIPFTIAMTLRRGGVGLDSFSATAIADPEVLQVADRVEHIVEKSWPTEEATRGILRIKTPDGTMHERTVDAPLGHPDNPMTVEAIRAKFADCATYARVPLGQASVTRIGHALEALEQVDNVNRVFA